MKKKYLYNGQLMELADIQGAATQSNMDVNAYIQKAGIREIDDSYTFNGKQFSAKDILNAANESKLGFDDYIQKAGFESGEKKNLSGSGTPTEQDITSTKSVPTTSQSPSQDVSFGQYDVFNDPLKLQKPVVSIAGVSVPINAPIQDVAPIPGVSNQETLTQQLQNRINTKTYTPDDIGVVAQSMKVSLPAASAYMKGDVGTGTVIYFDDIKKTKQDQLKYTIDLANKELGLSDTYEEVFASPELASAYIEKIQNIYSAKAQSEIEAVRREGGKTFIPSGISGSSGYNPVSEDIKVITNNSNNAAQKLKSIVSNEIVEKITDQIIEGKLNVEQGVKQIYTLVDSRDKANVERAIGKRLSPLRYMIDVAIGGNTTADIDLLNANKAGIEYKVNNTLVEKLNYNEALKKSIAEEYLAKIESQEISAEDEKAKDYYAKRISYLESETTELSKKIVPNTSLYEKYPVLKRDAITQAINDFNAIKSGNVAGYEDGGYDGVELNEHLAANGFEPNSQIVKDVLSDNKIKDYSIIGSSPIRTITDVFVNTGKAVLDFTPLRDEATILAEKKSAELFPTTVQPSDEFQLTKKAEIGQTIGNTTAQVLGQGLLQWGTAGLGRLAGLTKVAASNTAFFTSGSLAGYDGHLKESYDLPIDTDAGRVAYAGVNSIFEGSIEGLFKEAKLFQIPGFKDAAVQIASKLSTGELTEKLASELLNKAKNNAVNYVVKYGKNISQDSAEEGLTSAFNSATKLIVGDPNTNIAKAMEDVKNTVIQTAIGTSLIGGFGAHRDVQSERNVSAKSTFYNAAINHDIALDAINLGFQGNLYDAYERDAKVAILQTARQSIEVMEKTEKIEGKTLKRPQRELYVANLTAEATLTAQKKGMDEVGQKTIDVKVSNLQNQRQQILNGEVIIDENGNITTPTVKPIQTEVTETEVQATETTIPASTESVGGITTEATPTVLEERVPDITVSEMVDKVGTYKGEKGRFFQDGQTVVFKVDGQNREYKLGNIDEIKNTSISDYGITNEQSVVSLDDTGNITVREESYVNNFSNPLQAINRDGDGNVVSVNLETPDGKKRTFRGNVAEDVAYQIHLKEITKDNETRTNFENFINEDAAAQDEINNAAVSGTTTKVTDTPNGEVQRESIQPNTVTGFADRIVSGEQLSTPQDLQYYENNKTEIEAELKLRANAINQQTNTENQQGDIQTEAAQPTEAIVTETSQQTDALTKAKDLVNSGVVKGFTASALQEAANNNPDEFKQHLKEISEQAQDPRSLQGTINTYGQELVDIANELNPPPTQSENDNVPPVDDFANSSIPQADGIGIVHAATAELRKEAALPEYGKEAQTFKEWDAEADERIKNGEMPALLDKLRKGDQPSAVEVRMMGKYVAYLKGVVEKTKSNEDIARYHEAIQLSDSEGGTENARGLVARKGLFIDEGTLTDFFENELEVAKVDVLTDEQKSVVEKEHAEISAAQKEWDAERDRLNQQIKDLQAQAEIDKNKPKKKSTSTTKKTHEDYVKEREAIVKHLKEKLRQARSSTNVTVIPYAADLFAAAPDVARLVKSLVEEGVNKLGDVIDSVHETLKDGIPEATKDDVRDLIAGVYNAPQKTKSQTAKELFELKMEAKLINKLSDLQNGKQPVTNQQQIDYNQQIKDLRSQIAKFRKENITDDDKLQALKSRYATEIKKVEEDLKTGNFLKPQQPIPSVKLDKAALDAKDKLIKLKNDRQLRLIKEQYKNRPLLEKGKDLAANILNVPRALMTTLDFSAVLRQGLIPSIAHPTLAFQAGKQMFKSAWTQKEYDRWFYDLENSQRFNLMKESGLAITDNTNPNLTVREEDFMSNLAEKIPIVGEQLKTKWGTIPGANLIKKSERAYAAYINKLRVDLFNRFAASMEDRGLDFQNSPEQFKQMSEYINNSTGRGSLGKQLNKIAPILNGLLFSPRLIASRLNMLTYLAQPRFYKTVPKEVRKAYFADMGKFIGVGIAVLALAKYGGGDDDEEKELTVEVDPRSSDFGKIRQGDTRWDIWGGFQPFIRTVTQAISGERKTTTTGKIVDLDESFGSNRITPIIGFLRSKLAPVPGIALDLFSGRTAIGDKVIYEWGEDNERRKEISIDRYMKEHLLPLTYTGVKEAVEEKGIKAIFTVGIPSIFGIGVQTYSK